MNGNEEQIEYWNGIAGRNWAAAQERMDIHMGRITEALFGFAAPRDGERALDLGCGNGTTTLLLREEVGENGAAVGVDISQPMLAVARARAAAGNADVTFIESDVAHYDFQPVFDLALSRFGVMFYADPAAAFANIRTAMARNGRMAFVCWRQFAENGWAFAPFQAALPHLPPQEKPDPHAPGPFAFAGDARLRGILEKSGWRDIRIEKLDTTMNMGATLEEAVTEMLVIGPLAHAAREADEAARPRIVECVRAALQPFVTPHAVEAPASCWLVGAKA